MTEQLLDKIEVEVAYATPSKQYITKLKVPIDTTIAEAVKLSGIVKLFPEIDLQKLDLGIFSKPKSKDTIVRQSDRIEIYRPLIIEPKEARRLRAENNTNKL